MQGLYTGCVAGQSGWLIESKEGMKEGRKEGRDYFFVKRDITPLMAFLLELKLPLLASAARSGWACSLTRPAPMPHGLPIAAPQAGQATLLHISA
jgi:hypothetical protein